MYAVDEPAEIFPVFLGEDIIEKTWPQSEQVHQIFPSFVTTVNLLSWVTRWMVKQPRKIHHHQHDVKSMLSPCVIF